MRKSVQIALETAARIQAENCVATTRSTGRNTLSLATSQSWDAILLQHNETKHIAIGQVVRYAEWLEEATKPEEYEIEEGAKPLGFDVIYKKAYECARSLPQLFLD